MCHKVESRSQIQLVRQACYPLHHTEVPLTLRYMDDLQYEDTNIPEGKSLINVFRYLHNDNDFKTCKSSNAILELLHKVGFLSAVSEILKIIKHFLTIVATIAADKREF